MMKYRSESLFTKYQISPSKNPNELRVLFQTDPNKRKDLPVVIKTISNPAALLEEELLTPHDTTSDESVLSIHNRLLKNMASVLQEVNDANTKNALAEIVLIIKKQDNWSEFNYYSIVGNEKAASIIQEFISMIMDEIEKQFFSTIGEISWAKSKKFLQYLNETIPFIVWDTNRQHNFEEKLVEYVSKLSSLEGKSDSLDNRLSSALSIAEFLENKEITEMLRFSIKKIGDDYDNNGIALLKSYDKIAKLYDAQQLLEMSEFLNRMMNKYLDFHGTSNFSGLEIYNVATLLSKAYKVLVDKINGCSSSLKYDKDFDNEDIGFGRLLSDFMASTSATWINSYKSKLNKVKADDSASKIYDLIDHIMSANPSSKKLMNFLGQVVLKFTNFESSLAWAFEAHKEVAEDSSTRAANPKDIDDIIAKYYWTIYMIDDLNETMFNNIRSIGFDVLARVNSLTGMLNPYSSNYERQMVRDAVIKVLNTLPRDWYMDDKRVETVIRDFGGYPTGSVSVSSEYIDKYDYLFKGTKNSKHGRFKYENPYSTFGGTRSSTSTSSSSGYNRPSTSSSSSSSKSGCYVATCVYKSYDCPEVWRLRRYRDNYLDNHWWGRVFIKIYYAISPKLVKWFGNQKWFRNTIKKILDRKISKLEKKGYLDTPYNDKY